MITRLNAAVVALAALVVVAWWSGGDVKGQRKELGKARDIARLQEEKDKGKDKAKAKDDGKAKLETLYYGVSACAGGSCHSGKPPEKWLKDPDTEKPLDPLSRCDEVFRWKGDKEKKFPGDKHASAFEVLLKERGMRMAKILGFKMAYINDLNNKDVKKRRPAEQEFVKEWKACLACHSIVIEDETLRKKSVAVGFDMREGVSCVVCHGAHPEWVAPHGASTITAGNFRPLSRKEKETKYGMIDLWDPVRRTELCSTCHIGSSKEGKFVTHDMYAAGHPPLPGFEVATFSNEMPRHWEYLREKTPALQKELKLRTGEMEQASLVLIGAVVAFRDTMRLLEDQADEALKTNVDARKVLDLSNFDCYACHHDIKADAWRQSKEWYRGRKPGRVPMRAWSTELVRLAIEYLAGKDTKENAKDLEKELIGGMEKLLKAFDVTPTGDNAKIKEAAGALAKFTDGLAQKINSDKNYPKIEDARKILAQMPGKFDDRLLGYDEARQVAWAAEILNYEANYRKPTYNQVKKGIEPIDKYLKLRLPVGRDKLIEGELQDNLEKIANYDARTFRTLLRTFSKSLPTEK